MVSNAPKQAIQSKTMTQRLSKDDPQIITVEFKRAINDIYFSVLSSYYVSHMIKKHQLSLFLNLYAED